jgi:hypothetical protein
MRNLALDETLLAKSSFEQHANKGGVTINSYQADNGRFADSGFQWLFPDPKPGNISLPEQNQDVSNNANGTLINQETIGHNVSKICSLLECSPQFMSAFLVIWTRLEYLRLKIISNALYCRMSHHLAMEK